MTLARVRRQLIDAVTMFLVAGVSLVLLIYVAFGEAQRTYHQFHVEKLTAQGRVVQNALQRYLHSGLPLKQYAGFAAISHRILESDASIAAMMVIDDGGRPVFVNGDLDIPLLSAAAVTEQGASSTHQVRQDGPFHPSHPASRKQVRTDRRPGSDRAERCHCRTRSTAV